jgi:hypothetical protein
VQKQRLRDVALLLMSNDDGYAGLGLSFLLKTVKALYLFDVLDDAIGDQGSRGGPAARHGDLRRRSGKAARHHRRNRQRSTYSQLRQSVKALSTIGLRSPLRDARYIGVVGEIFVRRDHFS